MGVKLEHIDDAAEITAVDAAFSRKYAAEPENLKPILTMKRASARCA